MIVEMRLDQIQFFDTNPVVFSDGSPVYPGADGMVSYTVKVTYTDEEQKAIGKVFNPWSFNLDHPFQRSGLGKTPDGRNIWAWDGNREAPSLSPSFACDLTQVVGLPAKVHTYFTNGKIVDSGSENVVYA